MNRVSDYILLPANQEDKTLKLTFIRRIYFHWIYRLINVNHKLYKIDW